jgi:hypothetical protein
VRKEKARAWGRCGEERSEVDGEGSRRCADRRGCSGEDGDVGDGWWSPPASSRGGGGGIGRRMMNTVTTEEVLDDGWASPPHINGPNIFSGLGSRAGRKGDLGRFRRGSAPQRRSGSGRSAKR